MAKNRIGDQVLFNHKSYIFERGYNARKYHGFQHTHVVGNIYNGQIRIRYVRKAFDFYCTTDKLYCSPELP